MSLRSQEVKALRKAAKAMARCRRELGSGEFATTQEGLTHASEKIRNLEKSIATQEETFEEWIKKARIQQVRRS